MALTYEPIFTTTLTSEASINITSIPQTYTDLVLSAVMQGSSVESDFVMSLNGISGGYSRLKITGQGGSITYSSNVNTTEATIGNSGAGGWGGILFDIQDYTNTETNRNILYSIGQSGTTSAQLAFIQGCWMNSTSTALTSLQFLYNNWRAGTTVTMWGIKSV